MTETTITRVERAPSDYGTLMAQVQGAGLLERTGWSYLPRMLAISAMIAAGVVGFLLLGQSWWQLAVAAYFAVVFAQLGFLGHDAGHQQIFRSRRWNDRLGTVISNVGVGLSYRWWVDKHNRHHRNPNQLGRDPDIERNILAWTPGQAAEQRGFFGYVAKHQGVLFFPLLLLEAWNLHVGSLRLLLARPKGHLVELGLLLAHAAGCIAVLLVVLSPLHALAFLAVQQSLFGLYLGCSFAPNHKGMAIYGHEADDIDFLRRQVLTSRNVSGGSVLTAALGGLNYQIEHHLFPSMPSHRLRRVRPLVREFCLANGVSYCETSLFKSYAQSLRYLRDLRPDRPLVSPAG